MFQTIRFMGSKARLLTLITAVLHENEVHPGRALDACTGSGRVAWALREAGYEVVACDALRLSTVLGASAVGYQHQPAFNTLLQGIGLRGAAAPAAEPAAAVLRHLCGLPGRESFVTREYSPSGLIHGPVRKYFTVENAVRIDAIRHAIHEYSAAGLLSTAEHDYLLASLIVAASQCTNTQGHTDSFLETFQPRALAPVQLGLPGHLPNSLPAGTAIQGDATAVAGSLGGLEFAYLDPPYNHRRYDGYYHVLERIALGWFGEAIPVCVGKTGKPAVRDKRSPWCGRGSAPAALEAFLDSVDARNFLMSYSSEGVLQLGFIEDAIRSRGIADTFRLRRVRHPEYRGSRTRGGGEVEEYLFYVRLE
jgi:adenine-specific DNA-methyltransferase